MKIAWAKEEADIINLGKDDFVKPVRRKIITKDFWNSENYKSR